MAPPPRREIRLTQIGSSTTITGKSFARSVSASIEIAEAAAAPGRVGDALVNCMNDAAAAIAGRRQRRLHRTFAYKPHMDGWKGVTFWSFASQGRLLRPHTHWSAHRRARFKKLLQKSKSPGGARRFQACGLPPSAAACSFSTSSATRCASLPAGSPQYSALRPIAAIMAIMAQAAGRLRQSRPAPDVAIGIGVDDRL